MKKEKTIYDLKLHEGIVIDPYIYIARVHGGWLYDMGEGGNNGDRSVIFVPFDNEFMETKPIKIVKPNKEIKT